MIHKMIHKMINKRIYKMIYKMIYIMIYKMIDKMIYEIIYKMIFKIVYKIIHKTIFRLIYKMICRINKLCNASGHIPYTEWECSSDSCRSLMLNHTTDEFYTRPTICGSSLIPHRDFEWTAYRTSYAVQWGLICEIEYKGRNLISLFFVGAFFGVLAGTLLFDNIGRRTVTLIALFVTFIATLSNAFINSYNVMLALRVIQGFGSFTVLSGVQLLIIEFTPTNLRNLGTIIISSYWTLGTFTVTGMGYLLRKWDHMFLGVASINFLAIIPILILPESPRFQLIKGKEKEAKVTFRRIAKIFNSPIDLEKLQLDYEAYQHNYLDQLKDFIKYPAMAKNSVLLFFCYMILAGISYGLMYGWGSLGVDVYASILLSSLIGFTATVSGYKYFVTEKLGRRKALIVNFTAVVLCFLLAIPTVNLPKGWSLTQIMFLLAQPFMSSLWTGLFLLTAELSPTSHRGMIVCLNSSASRIGAFIGPYISLLYNEFDTPVVVALLTIGPIVAIGLAWFCQDSTDKPIPSTPEEVGNLKEIGEGCEPDISTC